MDDRSRLGVPTVEAELSNGGANVQHYIWAEWYSRERHRDRLRAAATVSVQPVAEPPPRRAPIRVRLERPSDAQGLDRLARAAQKEPPRGVVVVAEDGGKLVAAVELHRDAELVHPQFDRPEVVELVRLRAGQLARSRRAA